MGEFSQLVRDLYRTPWTLRSAVRGDESAWFAQNVHRRRLSLSRVERELLFAGEHPLRFAFSLLGCVDIYRMHTMAPTMQMNDTNRSASLS
jgi:hypothetical protein